MRPVWPAIGLNSETKQRSRRNQTRKDIITNRTASLVKRTKRRDDSRHCMRSKKRIKIVEKRIVKGRSNRCNNSTVRAETK